MLPWWKVILMQKVGCWRMLLTTKKRRRPSTTSAHALSDSDIVSKIFVVVHWNLSNHGHTTATSRRWWSIAVMILCWWHPFSNNLNCWQWVSAFMVAFFATPAQRSFLVNEDRQPLRTNYDVAIYYSSLYWVRSDPWFFLLHHGLVWSSSFHTSIDTTLAELVQALLHQPDGDKWCLTPLEKMIDFPDELLFARSPLTHVDYAEQRTTMLAHSQSLPSYYATPAEEPLS